MPTQQDTYSPLPHAWRERAFAAPGAILLETALPDAESFRSFLFTAPEDLLTADSPDQLPSLFRRVETALAQGKYVAGWLSYECGYDFQKIPCRYTESPLARLGIFSSREIFDHRSSAVDPRTVAPAVSEVLPLALMLQTDPRQYEEALRQIQNWIAAGDTYQVNYTVPASSRCTADPAHIYGSLLAQQPCAYAAVVRLEQDRTILSFSPELFFRIDANRVITTRPMKGTAPRGVSPVQDELLALALQNDEKSRAEHVMIVDLLRNDLGRICATGSIHVPDLFTVERYATLLQMTSTVRGQLCTGVSPLELLQALFPCGSVTGAPKHRTMQLIHQLEPAPRQAYTGAIGFFAPDTTACFNIAIRTATVRNGTLSMGVGSGIVADSTSSKEYAECLLKLRFVEKASEPLHLFETLRLDRRRALIPLHLGRLGRSAKALGFRFNPAEAESLINALPPDSITPGRIRLMLDRDGRMHLEHLPLRIWPSTLKVKLSATTMRSDDPALQHKTTFRHIYDEQFRRAVDDSFDEVLYRNERGELTEGCISNLIVQLGGKLYTPPCRSGALPGVMRQSLLDAGALVERPLLLHDLLHAEAAFLCNTVRGIGSITSLHVEGTTHSLRRSSVYTALW